MSKTFTGTELARFANVSASPVQTNVDRNFGLPTGLYVATVGAYFAFLGVMSAAFMTGDLAIPMAICVIYLVMAFGVPALWTRMKRDSAVAPLSWDQFAHRGIVTHTGPLTASQATVQVLMLPVLILLWGVAVAVIAASVA